MGCERIPERTYDNHHKIKKKTLNLIFNNIFIFEKFYMYGAFTFKVNDTCR